MSDSINQFAEHEFVEQIVLGPIEGHTRDASFEMEFHKLKIGGIATSGIGANLDIAIGNGGAAGFHRSFSFGNGSRADVSMQGGERLGSALTKCAKSLLAERRGEVNGGGCPWMEG